MLLRILILFRIILPSQKNILFVSYNKTTNVYRILSRRLNNSIGSFIFAIKSYLNSHSSIIKSKQISETFNLELLVELSY